MAKSNNQIVHQLNFGTYRSKSGFANQAALQQRDTDKKLLISAYQTKCCKGALLLVQNMLDGKHVRHMCCPQQINCPNCTRHIGFTVYVAHDLNSSLAPEEVL